MPIFEFRCSKCGREFEELVLSSAIESLRCPDCGSPDVEKKLSSFSSVASGKSGPSCNTFT